MKLPQLPPQLSTTREALHQLAFFALSPARYKVTGRMGLIAMPGGFGTPEFDGRAARVDGRLLVHEQDGNVATQSISTVRAAAEFFGNEYDSRWFADFHDPLTPMDPDTTLSVDEEASHAIGRWLELGFDVLNILRGHGTEEDDVSEVQLWPEHFDPATELGNQDRGERASFGASPGDAGHDEPYFYVAPWGEIDRSNPYWNDQSFNGSSLSYAELSKAENAKDRALEFLLEGYRILHAG